MDVKIEFEHIRRTDENGPSRIANAIVAAKCSRQVRPYRGHPSKVRLLPENVSAVTVCRLEENRGEDDILVVYGYALCTMPFKRWKGRAVAQGKAEFALRQMRAKRGAVTTA